jgi:catechol 2,3-dioxygenase-like lactoylglutathione lyase family enzyme
MIVKRGGECLQMRRGAKSGETYFGGLVLSVHWQRQIFVALLAISYAMCADAQSSNNPLGLTVDHVTASVIDIDRAVKWYQRMLGFGVSNRGTREHGTIKFAELEIPGFGVALVQVASASTAQRPPGIISPSWIHIVFSVPDPDHVYGILKEKGADVVIRNPRGKPGDSFLIHDSEGNEIEIVPSKGNVEHRPPIFTRPRSGPDPLQMNWMWSAPAKSRNRTVYEST